VRRRRWAWLVPALLLFAAAGCGGGGRHPAPGAHIFVELRPDGAGQVDFWVGGGVRSDRALRDLGARVTAALFRGRAAGPTVVEPGTAFPFARTEVPRAYERGPRPVFPVAGAGVGAALKAAGYPGYTLSIRLPRVRTSVGARVRPPGSEYSWQVSPGGPPPAAVIVMHPRLLHWAVEMTLLVVALAGTALAFTRAVTRIAFAGCAVVLVAATTVLASDGASGDSLGTLGHLSGTPLTVVTGAPLAALPLAFVAVVRLVRLLATPETRSSLWARRRRSPE
jgi:hypothetical protein